MRTSHFAQRLIIVFGCLGLILAVVQGQFIYPGIAPPDQLNATCKTQACDKLAKVIDHPNCPYNGADLRGSCIFASTMGDLIWCDAKDTFKCSPVNPINSNKCTGYCENMPALACDSTSYTKCVLP